MSASSQPEHQQEQASTRPLFLNWPTIKILVPPKGSYTRNGDQWCFTYSSQNVAGRIRGHAPYCRTVCIRHVFAHEVRNILDFPRHRTSGPDGKAKYPLPLEGQPNNLPRYLGGKPVDDPDEPLEKSRSGEDIKHWDEGWYFWATKSHAAAAVQIMQMNLSLPQLDRRKKTEEQQREVWAEYQAALRAGQHPSQRVVVVGAPLVNTPSSDGRPNKWWGPIVPPNPWPDTSSDSILVPALPDLQPLWEPVRKILAPSQRALELLAESFTSGDMRKFASRVWEKAKTDEPFILAGRACSEAYQRWKEKDPPPDQDEGKKGSA